MDKQCLLWDFCLKEVEEYQPNCRCWGEVGGVGGRLGCQIYQIKVKDTKVNLNSR